MAAMSPGISKVSALKRTTEVMMHREGGDPQRKRAYSASYGHHCHQGVPLSLLYFPINANAPVIACAIAGNLLFGISNLGLIKRNFAARLDNRLFANTQL